MQTREYTADVIFRIGAKTRRMVFPVFAASDDKAASMAHRAAQSHVIPEIVHLESMRVVLNPVSGGLIRRLIGEGLRELHACR